MATFLSIPKSIIRGLWHVRAELVVFVAGFSAIMLMMSFIVSLALMSDGQVMDGIKLMTLVIFTALVLATTIICLHRRGFFENL